MVILIPNDRSFEEFNQSLGEKKLYEKFKELSNDWYIFHSVKWSSSYEDVKFGGKRYKESESDFVIFNPNYGILTLEVKAGGYKMENGRLKQFRRDTGEVVSDKSPMDQADNSKYAFIRILSDQFENYNDRYKVNSAVWLTSVDVKDIHGNLPPNYHLGKNTFLSSNIDNIEEAFLECFKFYNVSKVNKINRIIEQTINLIAPEFKAIPSLSTEINNESYFIDTMTTQQSYLLDYLEEQKVAAIQGGAGTGKTVLAVEKARRLSQNEKVVYLCYNSMLIEHLREKYRYEMPNVEFTSLYKLTAKAFKKLDIEEVDIDKFLSNIDDYKHLWNFDSVIIDEGQDFTNHQIINLKENQMLLNEEASFYVFYDKYQLVQQRHDLEWLDEIECRLILATNCRNPLSVAKTSVSPLGINKIKIKKTNFIGDTPILHISNDIAETESWIANKIYDFTQNGVTKDRIVILTVKGLSNSIFYNKSKISNYSISTKREKGKILYTTARKYKGLESDIIFLVDVSSETFENEEQKRLFYVGASRAKHRLLIVSTIDSHDEKKMIKAMTNNKSSKRIEIMRSLQVNLE